MAMAVILQSHMEDELLYLQTFSVGDWTPDLSFAGWEFNHCVSQDHNGPQANLD